MLNSLLFFYCHMWTITCAFTSPTASPSNVRTHTRIHHLTLCSTFAVLKFSHRDAAVIHDGSRTSLCAYLEVLSHLEAFPPRCFYWEVEFIIYLGAERNPRLGLTYLSFWIPKLGVFPPLSLPFLVCLFALLLSNSFRLLWRGCGCEKWRTTTGAEECEGARAMGWGEVRHADGKEHRRKNGSVQVWNGRRWRKQRRRGGKKRWGGTSQVGAKMREVCEANLETVKVKEDRSPYSFLSWKSVKENPISCAFSPLHHAWQGALEQRLEWSIVSAPMWAKGTTDAQ